MNSKLAKTTAPVVDVVKLASYTDQAKGLITVLTEAPCSTPAEEAWFSESLSAVRGLIKGLDDERTSITKPILESKRRVDELFAPAVKPLQQCETIIRSKLQAAATARFQAAQAARLAADVAAAHKMYEEVVDILAAMPEAVATSGSSARGVWVGEVVDFSALPDKFKEVNYRALAELAKGEGEPAPVPGVTWRLEAKVRAK